MGDDAWMMMGGSGWMMDRQPVDNDRWMVMDRWRDGRMDGWMDCCVFDTTGQEHA